MAVFVKFNCWSEHQAEGVHNLDADTLRVYLTNATPDVAADSVKADLAEISAGNGYPAGGVDVQNATSRTGAVTTVTGVDAVITASGGPIGPFRYAVLYNDTPTSPADPLIGYWDYGAGGATINDTENLTVDIGSALLTLGA
jgi:hypothetical protein